MKFAVVDDNTEHAESLKSLIERYARENREDITVVCFADGIDVISDYAADYDAIFTDVGMKHMDGLKTVENIRQKDKRVIIFLVTGSVRYAADGYEYGVDGFMAKPVEYAELSRKLDRVIGEIKNDKRGFMVLSTDNGMDRVAIDAIEYIESQNHVMHVHAYGKVYRAFDTMRRLESALPPDLFFRCNNCYLINTAYIMGVHGDYVSVAGAELKVSRSRRKQFDEIAARLFGTNA